MKHRWTIPNGVVPGKDNWQEDTGELEVDGESMEWTGRCIFDERWDAAVEDDDPEEGKLHLEMQRMERRSR